MSNVHEAISKHSNKQHQQLTTFLKLDAKREELIEEAVFACVHSKPFGVEKINEVTTEMNELAAKGIVPLRKLVTIDMVKEFVDRKYGKN